MHQKAELAIKAVKICKRCGRFAARRFAVRNGVLRLYTKALQLEAVKEIM